MIRRWVVMFFALILTGCATIPTSGPVESVPADPPAQGVHIAPEPPLDGMSPTRLIEGFLQAMVDPGADYEVARQYLQDSVRDQWDPSLGATVYEGGVVEESGKFEVRGNRVGELDQGGRFTSSRDSFRWAVDVVEEAGEWRIAQPPEGVLISRFIFDAHYAHPRVYYISNPAGHVVPELLHLPDGMLTPEWVVEAQLRGPGDELAPTVHNAIPDGAELSPQGVTVDANGIAQVSLRNLPTDLSKEQRRELGAQLLWSLTAIPRVDGLRIRHEGSHFRLPGENGDGVLELSSQQGYQVLSRANASDLFGVRDGVAGRISTSGGFVEITTGDEPVAEVAVSLDGARIAVIDQDRSQVRLGSLGGKTEPVRPGVTNLRSAQFIQDELWLLGDNSQGRERLVRIDTRGGASLVDTSVLPGSIVGFSGSQTANHFAFITDNGKNKRLLVAFFTNGKKPVLEQWQELAIADEAERDIYGYTDVSWGGETELVVLAETETRTTAYLMNMDGSLAEHIGPMPATAVQITALPRMGGDAIVMRAEDDRLFAFEDRIRWSDLELELSQAGFPG